MKSLILAFEMAYELPEAKALLKPLWRRRSAEPGSPNSTGFCYIAAESAFYMLKDRNPKSFCASYVDDGARLTHWWIEVEGEVVDPTATQYTKVGKTPPYHLGRGKGFLTRQPSKRAQVLTRLVMTFLRPV